MDYVWSEYAINSLNKNNKVIDFGNPKEDIIMNDNDLAKWKLLLNNESLTFEHLVKYDLCKCVVRSNSKPKPKPKPKYKKVVKKRPKNMK